MFVVLLFFDDGMRRIDILDLGLISEGTEQVSNRSQYTVSRTGGLFLELDAARCWGVYGSGRV